MMQQFTAEVLRFFLSFLLLAATFGKLRSFSVFKSNLVQTFGLNEKFSAIFAPAVIATELLVSMLILEQSPWMGMLAALLLFSGFTTVVTYKFFTQSTVKCSCFGEMQRPLSGYDLCRNVLVIFSICAWLALVTSNSGAHLHFPQICLAAGVATILCVVAIDFHDIIILLRGA